jgi:hypothetical protein
VVRDGKPAREQHTALLVAGMSDHRDRTVAQHRVSSAKETAAFYRWLSGAAAFAAGVSILGGLVTLTLEAVRWLKFGFGPDWRFGLAWQAVGIGHPVVTWVGVQKIIDGLIDWPLWAGFLLMAVLFGLVAGWFFSLNEQQITRIREAERQYERVLDDQRRAAREPPA